MSLPEKEKLIVTPHPSKASEIGRWLGAIQDTRHRTLRQLDGLTPALIDWLPPNDESSIGTVLYHIALIEADWLYTEVLAQPVPAEVAALFPNHHRDEQDRLTQVPGLSLAQHLDRLETVRRLLLDVFKQMDLDEFRQARSLADYEVSPEWVLHHLMQHEAEHRSQIGALRAAAEHHLASA